MLSGVLPHGHANQVRAQILKHDEAAVGSSPSQDSAGDGFPAFAVLGSHSNADAQAGADDEEEDHFDDYVQGDVGYEDDSPPALAHSLPELDNVSRDGGNGDTVGQMIMAAAAAAAAAARPPSASGASHGLIQVERRDRQRTSASPSPLGSYSSGHSHRAYRHGVTAMIANPRSVERHSTSVSSSSSSPTSASISASAAAVVAAAEHILNPASYEGMNTRSYGLTILADGSNGSRAFMNPLTGTAREPHSSGSGAGTPQNGIQASYSASMGSGGASMNVYAQYARNNLPGVAERGGSIDPGSLRSSPFHLQTSQLHAQASTPVHSRPHAHHPHMQSHPAGAYPRNNHHNPPLHDSNGTRYPQMQNMPATVAFQASYAPADSPGLRAHQFGPKMPVFVNELDLDVDEDIMATDDHPSNAHSFTYGDPTLMPSPSASSSSDSESADARPSSRGRDPPLIEIGLEALQQEDDADEEPLYVNAKQYHRILKRRAARARLEELNQLIRQRKVRFSSSRPSQAKVPGGCSFVHFQSRHSHTFTSRGTSTRVVGHEVRAGDS